MVDIWVDKIIWFTYGWKRGWFPLEKSPWFQASAAVASGWSPRSPGCRHTACHSSARAWTWMKQATEVEQFSIPRRIKELERPWDVETYSNILMSLNKSWRINMLESKTDHKTYSNPLTIEVLKTINNHWTLLNPSRRPNESMLISFFFDVHALNSTFGPVFRCRVVLTVLNCTAFWQCSLKRAGTNVNMCICPKMDLSKNHSSLKNGGSKFLCKKHNCWNFTMFPWRLALVQHPKPCPKVGTLSIRTSSAWWRIRVFVYTYVCTYMYTHIYTWHNIWSHMYIYIYIIMYIYIYIHMYIHVV